MYFKLFPMTFRTLLWFPCVAVCSLSCFHTLSSLSMLMMGKVLGQDSGCILFINIRSSCWGGWWACQKAGAGWKGSGVIRISLRWGFREPGGERPWMEAPKESPGRAEWDRAVWPSEIRLLGMESQKTSGRRCQVLSDVSSLCVPFLPSSFLEPSNKWTLNLFPVLGPRFCPHLQPAPTFLTLAPSSSSLIWVLLLQSWVGRSGSEPARHKAAESRLVIYRINTSIFHKIEWLLYKL